VTSSTVGDVTFELACHEFQRTFYVLRDLRAADVILGLPWLDEEHASLHVGTIKVLTLMDGTTVETQLEERRPSVHLHRLQKFRNSCARRAATRDVMSNST
jgi:hypothetical protein